MICHNLGHSSVEGENQKNQRKQDTSFRSFCENEREINRYAFDIWLPIST